MIRLEGNKSALYQWDSNMRVILTDVPAGTEVHYSNTNYYMDENCITAVSYSENGYVYADIPNKILQKSGVVLAYLYIQDGDKAWTEFETEILVLPRKKPADYVYTETEIKTFESLEKRIENLESTQDPDAIKNAVEDYIEQNPVEVPVQSVNGKTGAVELNAENVGAISQSDLQEATNELAAKIPDVDDTLKEAGKAADAAAVGNRLSKLSEEIVTTAESKVAAHNTGTDTHSDIRVLIQGLTDRLNALADSDDMTLDQLSEVVAYIKSNRSLIEAITTSKVGVADIVDNLTTNVSNKPLSAAQGVTLKALIDAIEVPSDDHINSLIDTKLGVIENGSY